MRSESTALCVQIVYYDGQFDDSRLCVALACTAALAGAAVTNHTEATKLLKVPYSDAYAATPDLALAYACLVGAFAAYCAALVQDYAAFPEGRQLLCLGIVDSPPQKKLRTLAWPDHSVTSWHLPFNARVHMIAALHLTAVHYVKFLC